MNMNDVRILIVGRSAAAYALAKKLNTYKNVKKVFVAGSEIIDSDSYQKFEIREDDLTNLLKFALDNDITMTIPVSERALKADIVTFFQENGQNIFGATKDACKICINKSFGKKFLYKIHAQTSKFGVFDRQQPAEDWLQTSKFPVLIRTSENSAQGDRLVCPSLTLAREYTDNLYSRSETDVLFEEFVYGHNFTVYYITDGYSALPIGTSCNYKFTSDGDGGFYTNGLGCYTPDYKISETVYSRLDNVVRNTLVALDKKGCAYVGILGINCTLLEDDKFVVNEFQSFLQDFDASAVLNLIDDDLVRMFNACVTGLFADEYTQIKTNSLASVSAVVLARNHNKKIRGFDKIEDISNIDYINVTKTLGSEYLTRKGECFTITRTASTLSRAREYLYEDLKEINFDGIKYRKDICR